MEARGLRRRRGAVVMEPAGLAGHQGRRAGCQRRALGSEFEREWRRGCESRSVVVLEAGLLPAVAEAGAHRMSKGQRRGCGHRVADAHQRKRDYAAQQNAPTASPDSIPQLGAPSHGKRCAPCMDDAKVDLVSREKRFLWSGIRWMVTKCGGHCWYNMAF